jgi:hypothetical protein
MQEWGSHKIALRNPPTERMRDVHKLHIAQSVAMIEAVLQIPVPETITHLRSFLGMW